MASTKQYSPPKQRPRDVATDQQKQDGWENTITSLGTARDKRSGTRIKVTPFQAARTKFDEMYHGDDTSATIAELPPGEMTREWITMQVDDSVDADVRTEADVEEKMLTAKKVMQSLDDLMAKSIMKQGLTWARVHGGALVFLGVDDGVEDLTEPLDLDRVKSLDFLTVFDRWEVRVQTTNDEMRTKNFGKPETYTMQASTETGLRTVEAEEIHASRFIRFDGVPTTRFRMARNNGWSDSVYVRMEETLQDYGISWSGITHLLQTANQAVLKMKGLSDAICESESTLVLDRMTAMDLCRSIVRMIPIDAEDEDFMNVSTSFAGIPETIDRLMLRVASAARMPATLLFGQSPAGLNATGDSDIRFFYDQIKAKQEDVLRPALDRLLEVIFAAKDGPTGGKEPENWSYKFNPLWQMTDEQEANVKKTTAETDQIYLTEGVLDQDEVAQSRFGGDAYSTETVLDTAKRAEEPDEPEPTFVPMPIPNSGEPGMLEVQGGQDPVTRLMHMDEFDKEMDGVCNINGTGYNASKCAAMKRARNRVRGDRFEHTMFAMTNAVNGHAHVLDLPGGPVHPGVYNVEMRDGHTHVLNATEKIEVGEKVTLTTTGANDHTHTIVIEPVAT